MNSTSCFTPNCLFNWKKKKKERGKDTHRNAPTTGQKFFFHRIKKKGEKKRNILFENVRQHDTIGTLRFFFHGSRLRFSLFIAKPVAQPRFDTPPLTYTCTHLASLLQVVAIEIYATKGVRERERKRRDKEKFSKILQEDVSRERGYSSSEEESPI